jgi:hypothetical protein
MKLPRSYRAKDRKYRVVKKVVDNTDTGPRPHVGQNPRPTSVDDYSCWTDRSQNNLRDNDQKTPLDYVDVDKPQGM